MIDSTYMFYSPAQSGLFFFLVLTNYSVATFFIHLCRILLCFHVIAPMLLFYQLFYEFDLFHSSLFHYTFMFIGAPCYYVTTRAFTDRHKHHNGLLFIRELGM
jgi:hypothetical protein